MQNIAVPLKYLHNIWRTLEMPLTNCENNLILIWSKHCAISKANSEGNNFCNNRYFIFLL